MNFQAVVAIFCYGEKTFAVFFCKLCVLREAGAIDIVSTASCQDAIP